MRLRHAVQREFGRLLAPLWVPVATLYMRYWHGLRIRRLREIRREFRRIRKETPGPLVICANHLTMVDSFVIAWGLAHPLEYCLHFDRLPWNTPERANFATTRRARFLAYVAKCIPISRGGSRGEVGAVLDRVIHLTQRGEVVLLFPEGGRSRSGRVDADRAAWGVGRVVGALPGCRVVCVYMRGDEQATWSRYPLRGDSIYMDITCIEPKSDARGVRRSVDFARQITGQLAQMERDYFDRRQ